MTKYTQKFKLDLIQEYLDTGCSQRCLENKYSLPKDTLKKWWTVYNLYVKIPNNIKTTHFQFILIIETKQKEVKLCHNGF